PTPVEFGAVRPTTLEQLADASPPETPAWYAEISPWDVVVPQRKLPVDLPLLHPDWSRAFLTDNLAQPDPSGPLDVERCITILASGQPLTRFPRLSRPTLRYGVQVLVDTSDAMILFHLDQRGVVEHIQQLYSSDKVEVLNFRECPGRGVYTDNPRQIRAYEPPPPETSVLILSDMGMAQPPLQLDRVHLQEWTDFLKRLTEVGVAIILLTPYAADRLPWALRVDTKPVYWDRRKLSSGAHPGAPPAATEHAQKLLAEFQAEFPGAYRLAVYAS